MTKQQNIFIVRYGLTEFPLVESVGPFDSDINTEVKHAGAIARKIAESGDGLPKHVYASPFLRTVHTGSIIAESLVANGAKPLRIEDGLTEWKQPSLLVEPNGTRTYPKSVQEHSQRFPIIDTDYKSQNPVANDDNWEDEEALYQRCATTLDKILDLEHGNNFVLVSHAPCDIAMAGYLEGKQLKDSTLPPLALGGITRFSRVVQSDGTSGEWKMESYGSTDHMPGEYKDGLKHWTLPSLAKTA